MMDTLINTYERIGIPEALAIPMVLIALSLTLAPWFGGSEIGPIKIPQLTSGKWTLRVLFPSFLALGIVGFYPIWSDRAPKETKQTVRNLFSEYDKDEYDAIFQAATNAFPGISIIMSTYEKCDEYILYDADQNSVTWRPGNHIATVRGSDLLVRYAANDMLYPSKLEGSISISASATAASRQHAVAALANFSEFCFSDLY